MRSTAWAAFVMNAIVALISASKPPIRNKNKRLVVIDA
jgi:hypothetical protein